MKKLLLGLSILFASSSFAQITITSANMPVSGDTFRTSSAIIDTTILQNYLKSGANQTWDFSAMIPRGQSIRRFVPSSQTPYTIPGSRIGLLLADTLDFGGTTITEVYSFITATATDFSVDYRAASAPVFGTSFPIQVPYQDKDEVFQFPLDYLDIDSSIFNFVFNNSFPPLYYGGSGVRINSVEGWGTVTTPYGSFNSLKVVSDLISKDTVSATGQNFAIETHLREYQWMAIEERIPVMKVSGNVFAGVFIPSLIEYRDSVRVIEPILPTTALFRADSTTIEINKQLNFTNLSLGSDTYQWSFVPNTVNFQRGTSSTSRDITVAFLDTGKYTVRLIVNGGSSSDVLTRIDYITATSGVPLADFMVENDSAISNLDFTILNKSTYGENFTWSFIPDSIEYRNGTTAASIDSIVVRFTNKGFYSVILEATNASGSTTSTQTDAIFVQFPVSIAELNVELNAKISISPNPVKPNTELSLIIDPTLQLQNVLLYSINGKLMEQLALSNANLNSLVAPAVAGVYFYNVVTNEGSVLKKVIVE